MVSSLWIQSAFLIMIVAVWQVLWNNWFMVPPTPELRAALMQGYPNAWYELKDVKNLVELLKRTGQEHSRFVLSSFCMAYIVRHIIPVTGEFYMNVIAGAIYGFWLGLLLVTPLTVLGSYLSNVFAFYFFGRLNQRQERQLRDYTSRITDSVKQQFGLQEQQTAFQWHNQIPITGYPPNFPLEPYPPPFQQQPAGVSPAALANQIQQGKLLEQNQTNQFAPNQAGQTSKQPVPLLGPLNTSTPQQHDGPFQGGQPMPTDSWQVPTKYRQDFMTPIPQLQSQPQPQHQHQHQHQHQPQPLLKQGRERSCPDDDPCIRHQISNYYSRLEILIFARLVPFMPSVVINMGLAIIGVGFREFITSCLFGSIPYNVFGLIIGSRLSQLHSVDDVFNAVSFSNAWAVLIGVFISMLFKLMASGSTTTENAANQDQDPANPPLLPDGSENDDQLKLNQDIPPTH